MSKFYLFFLGIFLFAVTTTNAYESTYENISWSSRGDDTFYCLDICDENWNIYPGFQAIQCGEGFYGWSPGEFARSFLGEDLPDGFTFNWRVWSPSGYGDKGFEGQVVVGQESKCQGLEYLSTPELIQWSCRNDDSNYCIDIFDADWNMLYQAVKCGEGLHSYSPSELNFSAETYNWKIWSPGGYGGDGFEGSISFQRETHNNSPIIYFAEETSFQTDAKFRIEMLDDGRLTLTQKAYHSENKPLQYRWFAHYGWLVFPDGRIDKSEHQGINNCNCTLVEAEDLHTIEVDLLIDHGQYSNLFIYLLVKDEDGNEISRWFEFQSDMPSYVANVGKYKMTTYPGDFDLQLYQFD